MGARGRASGPSHRPLPASCGLYAAPLHSNCIIYVVGHYPGAAYHRAAASRPRCTRMQSPRRPGERVAPATPARILTSYARTSEELQLFLEDLAACSPAKHLDWEEALEAVGTAARAVGGCGCVRRCAACTVPPLLHRLECMRSLHVLNCMCPTACGRCMRRMNAPWHAVHACHPCFLAQFCMHVAPWRLPQFAQLANTQAIQITCTQTTTVPRWCHPLSLV